MTPAKRHGKTWLCLLIAACFLIILVGCYPSNVSWNSLKFWQGAKQGQTMDDKTMARFLSQIRVRPGNPDAHYNLASYYQERGFFREAIAEYKKVIMIDPGYIKAHNGKGICHDQIGEHDEAIACFKRAVALDTSQEYVWNNLCYSYYLKGNYREAVAACEQAVTLNTGNLRIRNNLAMVLAMSGQYDRAFKEFIIAGRGDQSYAHLKMAAIYHDKAMFAQAIEHYRAALKLNSESEAAQKGLIASNELLRIAEAAKIQADSDKGQAEAIDTPVANHVIMKTAGDEIDKKGAVEEYAFARKLYEQGSFKEAVRHFERSLTLDPRMKSANRGMAAAKALEKIAAAPSTKNMASKTDRNNIYRDNASILFERIGIEVSNGNGKRHMARDMGKYLRKKGFNVVSLSNAPHFNYDSGRILYEKDYKNVAEAIAARIPQLSIMKEVDKSTRSKVKVRVVIGKDLLALREQYRN